MILLNRERGNFQGWSNVFKNFLLQSNLLLLFAVFCCGCYSFHWQSCYSMLCESHKILEEGVWW